MHAIVFSVTRSKTFSSRLQREDEDDSGGRFKIVYILQNNILQLNLNTHKNKFVHDVNHIDRTSWTTSSLTPKREKEK